MIHKKGGLGCAEDLHQAQDGWGEDAATFSTAAVQDL